MGEIICMGLSHYPPLSMRDGDMAMILRDFALQDPGLPESEKDPASWPPLMRAEWGSDGGTLGAARHRRELVACFDRCRAVLDDFRPDVIVMWGDDQYENFREDLIPPFTVLAFPDLEVRPWQDAQDSSAMKERPNAWDEDDGFSFILKGRPDIGKHLVGELLAEHYDVSYAYEQLHHPSLPHAFLNAVLYLDYHRRGFPYALLPFPINCYGRRVVSYKGFVGPLGDERPLDPPSPAPSRLMGLGAATARVLKDSPWRVALVASSSWSHAFLTDRTYRLRPDTPSDKTLYEQMTNLDYASWRGRSLDEIEGAGQQEVLNWFPMMGAVEELGLTLDWSEFVQTDVFNSNKVFASFV